jgi:hypothetical protein
VLVPPLLLLYKFLGDLLKVHKRSAFEVIFSVLLTFSQGVNDPPGFRRRHTRKPIAKQCKAINLHSLLANQLKAIRNINSRLISLNDRRRTEAPPSSRCALGAKASNCPQLPAIPSPIIGEGEPR